MYHKIVWLLQEKYTVLSWCHVNVSWDINWAFLNLLVHICLNVLFIYPNTLQYMKVYQEQFGMHFGPYHYSSWMSGKYKLIRWCYKLWQRYKLHTTYNNVLLKQLWSRYNHKAIGSIENGINNCPCQIIICSWTLLFSKWQIQFTFSVKQHDIVVIITCFLKCTFEWTLKCDVTSIHTYIVW